MSEPLRIGLVGLGRIARAHFDALAGRADVQVVGGVEPDLKVADAWEKLGVPTYNETISLVEFARPAGVIVCSPPDTHHALVRSLLLSGMHVLVEKPLARTARDAWTLVRLARDKGRVLQTASKFRAMPSLARAIDLLRSGAIGLPSRVENVFSGPLDVRTDWRSRPELSGGGVWMDNGPHSLDVLTALFGTPQSVRVVRSERRQQTAVEDDVTVELAFPEGQQGTIRLSWNEAVRAPIAKVVGSGGELELGWGDLRVRHAGCEDVEPGGYDKLACFRAVHDHFFAAIRDHLPADDHGARTLALVEAGYRSAATGGDWQPVEVDGR